MLRMASLTPTPMLGSKDFRFTDKEWDVDTGYVYFGARYYDPSLGRWISPDPLVVWGGGGIGDASALAYVGNAATVGVDLDGLSQYSVEELVQMPLSAEAVADAIGGDFGGARQPRARLQFLTVAALRSAVIANGPPGLASAPFVPESVRNLVSTSINMADNVVDGAPTEAFRVTATSSSGVFAMGASGLSIAAGWATWHRFGIQMMENNPALTSAFVDGLTSGAVAFLQGHDLPNAPSGMGEQAASAYSVGATASFARLREKLAVAGDYSGDLEWERAQRLVGTMLYLQDADTEQLTAFVSNMRREFGRDLTGVNINPLSWPRIPVRSSLDWRVIDGDTNSGNQ